jgi:hypothetical protein
MTSMISAEAWATRLLDAREPMPGVPAAQHAGLVPVTLDRVHDRAAIFFAEYNRDVRRQAGWWIVCVAFRVWRGAWRELGEDDCPWDPAPWTRPGRELGSFGWQQPGSVFHIEGGLTVTTVFGATSSGTASIRVRSGSDGTARSIVPDLRTGAYTAILGSTTWELEGYAADGLSLGALRSCPGDSAA